MSYVHALSTVGEQVKVKIAPGLFYTIIELYLLCFFLQLFGDLRINDHSSGISLCYFVIVNTLMSGQNRLLLSRPLVQKSKFTSKGYRRRWVGNANLELSSWHGSPRDVGIKCHRLLSCHLLLTSAASW